MHNYVHADKDIPVTCRFPFGHDPGSGDSSRENYINDVVRDNCSPVHPVHGHLANRDKPESLGDPICYNRIRCTSIPQCIEVSTFGCIGILYSNNTSKLVYESRTGSGKRRHLEPHACRTENLDISFRPVGLAFLN